MHSGPLAGLPLLVRLLIARCMLERRRPRLPNCTPTAPTGPLHHAHPSVQIIASDTLPADDERSLHGLTLKRLAHFLRFVYEPSR